MWWEELGAEVRITNRQNLVFRNLTEAFDNTSPSPRVVIVSFPHNPTTATWTPMTTEHGEPQEIRSELPGLGYTHEALEVVRCVGEGRVVHEQRRRAVVQDVLELGDRQPPVQQDADRAGASGRVGAGDPRE